MQQEATTKTISGGAAVVASLEALGVTHVFGIASVHNLPIFEALSRSEQIELVPARHEQGAVHAADGYARATGRLGVAITSTGPGAANAMGGLFEAGTASSRVLMITGQVPSAHYGKGRSALHQAENQIDMLRSVCKLVVHVESRDAISAGVVSAGQAALSGKPSPAAVEIPIDFQSATAASADLAVQEPITPTAQPGLVAKAVTLLAEAKRPLIWAGGGAVSSGAATAVRTLAETLGAPVVTSSNGRGSIPEDHQLSLGPNTDLDALDPVIEQADVVLAVGTRFRHDNRVHIERTIPGRLIHIDIDPAMIDLVHHSHVSLVGDASQIVVELVELLDDHGPRVEESWLAHARAARQQVVDDGPKAMGPDHERVVSCIRDALPRHGVVVKDATVPALIWGHRYLEVYEPRTSLRPVAMGIGPAVPLAIGAAVGSESPTVVIQGDGGLMLSVGELPVAVQQSLPIVVCVFNDGGYGVLRWIQEQTKSERFGVDLATPDFAELGHSMGLNTAHVANVDEFEEIFPQAIASGEPWLLDIDLTNFADMTIIPQNPKPRA